MLVVSTEAEVPAEASHSDNELWQLILRLEDQMWAEGTPPKMRHFELPMKAMEALGFEAFVIAGEGSPPLLERIRALHGTLYRRKDVAAGGIHGGAFMFRGIATNVYVPIIYGRAAIDPYKFCDLSARQIQWLRFNPKQDRAYLENFCNLFDFAACLSPMSDYGAVPDGALPMLRLSAFQTQSAAATLCVSFDERGAVQSALIAAELAMKGALKGASVQESKLKEFGHDFEGLAKAVGEAYPGFQLEQAMELAMDLPALVPNRYSEEQPDRVHTGKIVMASQGIAGLVAQALTGGSLWAQISNKLGRR